MITTKQMTMDEAAAYMVTHRLAASQQAAREVLREARASRSADRGTYTVDCRSRGGRRYFQLLIDEPADMNIGTKLRFRQGDAAGTILTGLVTRAPWGREGTTKCVTIATLEDPPRTFSRQVTDVVVIGDESVFELGQS